MKPDGEEYFIEFPSENADVEFLAICGCFQSTVEYLMVTGQTLLSKVKELDSLSGKADEVVAACKKEMNTEGFERLKNYRKWVNSLFGEYTSEQRWIIRRAYFFYTSKHLEREYFPQIKSPAREKKKYTNASDTIKGLFDEDMLKEEDLQSMFEKIDIAIEKKTQTRGSTSKKFTKKMNDELDRLQISKYKQDEIVANFEVMMKNLTKHSPKQD